MTTCSLEELKKFLHTFPVISPVADFGGGRASKKIARTFKKEIGILEHTIYDLEGKRMIEIDLTVQKVKEKYSTIICMDTLEHVVNPFNVAGNIAQALEKDGYAFITAPFNWKKHGKDYWRFTKEGLWALFRNTNVQLIKSYEIKDEYEIRDKDAIRSVLIIKK